MSKLIASFLFLTVAGFADTIQFTGLPANTQYGTYNGYAFATVDGDPLQQLICDDFDHTTYVPSGNMSFSLSTLLGPNPLEGVRFIQPGDFANTVTQYEEAALLLNGMRQSGPGTLLDLTADYQYALWHLFTPSVVLPNATAQTLLNDVANQVRSGGSSNWVVYSELRVYTPDAAFASNQEFLEMAPTPVLYGLSEDFGGTTATPEPPGGILFAIGIAAIALSLGGRRLLRRRKSASAASA